MLTTQIVTAQMGAILFLSLIKSLEKYLFGKQILWKVLKKYYSPVCLALKFGGQRTLSEFGT